MSEETTYIGPLTPSPDQLAPIIALLNGIFYASKPFKVTDEFPLLFCREGLKQLRIFTRDSKPVAHAATIINEVSAFGCRVRVACLGAVCTVEADRGHSLAGQLVDDAVRRAASAGAAIMLISGHRQLYTRRGAHKVGRFFKYTIPVDSLAQHKELSVTKLSAKDCERALQLYQAEPIHFCRTVEQYTSQTSTGFVMNRKGKTYLVRQGNNSLAVLTVWHRRSSDNDSQTNISTVEFAGSRTALLSGLPEICRDYNAAGTDVISYTPDNDLLGACRDPEIEPQEVPFSFTVKLLDAQQLWQDFEPLLAERIGLDRLSEISLHPQADEMEIHTLTFRADSGEFTVRGSQEVLASLFGSTELAPLAQASGQLGQTLRQALPLPLPQYGLNFL